MKKNIHAPNYREVAFNDISSKKIFIIKSCVETKKTIKYNDIEYPLKTIEISSSTHPFYTGNNKSSIVTGRVERFNRRLKKSIK